MSMSEVLEAAHRKYGHGGIDERTPVQDLMEREESCELDSVDAEREMQIRMEAFGALLEYLFQDGAHPGHTCRHLYVLAKTVRPELLMGMGMRELGKLFGDSHGAMHWRCKQVREKVKAMTGQELHVHWQKSASSSKKYSESQKGNRNRANGERSKKLKQVAAK